MSKKIPAESQEFFCIFMLQDANTSNLYCLVETHKKHIK